MDVWIELWFRFWLYSHLAHFYLVVNEFTSRFLLLFDHANHSCLLAENLVFDRSGHVYRSLHLLQLDMGSYFEQR